MSENPPISIKEIKNLVDNNKKCQFVWLPQPGSQTVFVTCPVPESLFEGTRGPGKTDTLFIDFLQDVGKGYGMDLRGIIFRHTYKQLKDIVVKSKKILANLYFLDSENRLKQAKFNGSDYSWTFPGGEQLLFSYMRRPEDYYNYHGHEYNFIGWEELTNWPSSECYDSMKATWRSTNAKVPMKYRSTCNPFGIGHNWVKQYFIDPAPPGKIMEDEYGNKRVRISGSITENKILMVADPAYINKLKAIKNPNKRKAWLFGSWDIVAGGGISDIWTPEIHIVKPFEIPIGWKIDRGFDWGSSKPYAVGYFAEADGMSPVIIDGETRTFPKHTLFLINEIYGCKNGEADIGVRHSAKKIAQIIMNRDAKIKADCLSVAERYKQQLLQKGFYTKADLEFIAIAKKKKVIDGPADGSIYDGSRGKSIADQMESWDRPEKDKTVKEKGVTWVPSDRSPGSRIAGLEFFRDMLDNSVDPYKEEDSEGDSFVDLSTGIKRPMQYPGFFVFNTCRQFLRTVPVLPRDENNPDDINTESEDHIYDMVRYRVLELRRLGVRVQGF